jgi:4-amino-4-deoxy-L-arabinose transferase-like glycosyltransferase
MARPRLLEALPLAGLLAACGLLFARSLDTRANFDEGVYLASLDALRHGQALGTEVDIPQPPGFYVLLQAVAAIFGNSVTGVRLGFLLVSLAGLLAAYVVGRHLAGPWGGFAAAALLATTAPYPTLGAQVEADTVCTVLGLGSIALLVGRSGGVASSAAAGALAGAAVSAKLLAAPVAVPIAVLLVARRSWRHAAAFVVGGAIVVGALLARYAYALGALYHSVIDEHRRAQSLGPGLTDNVERVLLHPVDWHTPAAVLVPLGVVLAVVLVRRIETAALVAWIVASAAFLVYQRPLLDHHMVLLATALATTAGAGLGAGVARLRRRALVGAAAVGVALAAGYAQEYRRLARNDRPEPPEVRWAVSALRTNTRPDELVGTDIPIAPYLADRRVAGQLIDSSYGRLNTEVLTTEEILAVLEKERVLAVLVGRNYQSKPDLLAELARRYPRRLRNGYMTLYLKRRA